jgi:predicted Zn-dependent protease
VDRIGQLESFIKEDPGDPFNHYALALEYLKTDPARAHEQFEWLLQQHPDYLPTYYPLAHLLIELGKVERGEQVFKSGIEKARSLRETKTMRELQAAYDDWLFLRE